MIPELKRELEHQHYKVVGDHSAVKLCFWLRKSMRDSGVCYKQKFYGIESHRCMQMTPWIICNQSCLYCWRVIEKTKVKVQKIDNTEEIIEGCIHGQRQLISGFKGFSGVNLKKWKEAQNPNNAAISLIGEPTLYPKLSQLIEEFHKRGFSTFLVTNGQFPEALGKITEPTNLYISLDAPDKDSYKRIDIPSLHDFWERLNKSLELMPSFSCRKVIRLTLVKGRNMHSPEKYAKLIEKSGADFVEAKGYVHVGESQKRLPRDTMPTHEEVKAFAESISKHSGYRYRDEQKESRVVLLAK
ncbi:MAG: 4-demethylwyosine synthase TYW1 [Candidatus Aenigmarchaeota archaeon]|nr:4-demethylwyosine synthase TYW1 [Candidatus Aenigmarchaeota archaeon]